MAVSEKVCSKCGESKPATFEYFYRRKETKDGLRSDCRVCRDAQNRAWAEAHREQHRAGGRRRVARYREQHKDELRERWRERYYSDPEFRALHGERRMEHHRRDPDHQLEVHRRWYDRHRDDLNALRRQRWADDPEKYRVKGRRRRARKLAAPGSHTPRDVEQQYKAQHGHCYWCGEKVDDYHVDHVIPLAKGGSDGPDNIVISCKGCNLRKNARMPHECMGRLC